MILSIVFFVPFLFAQAQTSVIDSLEKSSTLINRVESLEHELSHLKLSYELDKLAMDIQLCQLDISKNVTDIRYALSQKFFKKKLASAFEEEYEASRTSVQSLKDRVCLMESKIEDDSNLYSYEESEKVQLTLRLVYIRLLMKSFEPSLNVYESTVDYYKDKL